MSDQNQAYGLTFASIGQDVTIWPAARIIGSDHMTIGDSVIIDDFVFLMATDTCTIGSFVHIAGGASVAGGGRFIAEDFAGVSGGTRIYTGNEDYGGGSLTNPAVPEQFRQPARSSVRLGKHSIIGANSVVLPGVEIGEGAAVGALSLVTRDLEPWTIYAGSPARPVRSRPKERMLELERLLRSQLYDERGNYIPTARRASRPDSRSGG